jgi:hypothetical protein
MSRGGGSCEVIGLPMGPESELGLIDPVSSGGVCGSFEVIGPLPLRPLGAGRKLELIGPGSRGGRGGGGSFEVIGPLPMGPESELGLIDPVSSGGVCGSFEVIGPLPLGVEPGSELGLIDPVSRAGRGGGGGSEVTGSLPGPLPLEPERGLELIGAASRD